MIDIDETVFEAEVIRASHATAVLVDFWAPWCGPCQALGPLLERLEQSYDGRFRLVKVNSDVSPGVAARYGVRGIPNVIAFVDGEPVDRFVGALPENEIRAFIDRAIPDAAERQRRNAANLAGAGRIEEAAAALRAAIELNPANESAHLDLAELLLERMPPPVEAERLSQAEEALEAVGRAARESRWHGLAMRLSSLRGAASLPPVAQLLSRVAAEPSDLGARGQLAQAHIAQRQLPQALEQLLEIVARGRGETREAARLQIVAVLQLLADQPQIASDYRRRLALLLHR
ncbi:MAG: tetratricopeptide repeat protein [Proteobacteria bacterium]|nr:tetratricopeptide repeat protein [Pseudomonadota bacterium]